MNLRADEPDKAIARPHDERHEGAREGFFSFSLSQLMVLLNGLILTGIAYFALSVFITGTMRDEYRTVVEDTQQVMTQSIADMGQAMQTVALIYNAAPKDQDGRAAYGRLLSSVPHLQKFDRLFWLGQDEAGRWIVQDFLAAGSDSSADYMYTPEAAQMLKDFVLANGVRKSRSLALLTHPSWAQYKLENNSPVVKGRPFIMARAVDTGTGQDSLIVGVSRIHRILGDAWFQNKPGIESLLLQDVNTGERLFYMDRQYQSADRDGAAYGQQGLIFPIGTASWQMLVETGYDSRAVFLKNIPLIVLVLGGLFTVIGSLFVRHNQTQSHRILLMNNALTQKTFDLGIESTERQRLHKSLRRVRREYKAIVDAVNDIIFEVTPDGTIMFLNGTWKKITGFDIEESLNEKLYKLIHPQDHDELRRNLELAVRREKDMCRMQARLRGFDGSFRAVDLAFSIVREEEGQQTRVVGTITDIEERRRAERALSEADKQYRTIVENAAGGIYQITPEGHFLSANPAMARILGYDTPDALLSDAGNIHQNIYKNQNDRMRLKRELEVRGVVKNFETQIYTKSGHLIWINENARAVKDDDGNILYFEGSVEDITKRKETELKLREAKIHSDLSNRAKSEFLANMSHELRTPLNAIIGFSEIIKDEVFGKLENRQYWEYAQDIFVSGRKLLDIINEILDLSRIETGDRQLNESLVNIHQLVVDCLDFVSPKADEGQLALYNMVGPDAPELVGEELALKQILTNLLTNAVKFTPEGGRITLSQEVDHDGHLRLSVTDTGVGLNEDEIAKALSPFGQVDTAMNRSGSGVGLGLTLVDSLVKLHGGRLELFSQKGIGTTATVIFPASRVQQSGQAAGEQRADGGAYEGHYQGAGDGHEGAYENGESFEQTAFPDDSSYDRSKLQ